MNLLCRLLGHRLTLGPWVGGTRWGGSQTALRDETCTRCRTTFTSWKTVSPREFKRIRKAEWARYRREVA